MSSALERIRQIRQDIQGKTFPIQTATEKQPDSNCNNLTDRSKKEIRIQHVTEIGQRILSETHIISQLKDIEREECSKFPKHAVVVKYDEQYATATLAWGKWFQVKDNEIQFDTSSGRLAKKDYYYVKAEIDPDTENIRIYGIQQPIRQSDWQSNPEVISNAIAKSFLEPLNEHSFDPGPSSGTCLSGGDADWNPGRGR